MGKPARRGAATGNSRRRRTSACISSSPALPSGAGTAREPQQQSDADPQNWREKPSDTFESSISLAGVRAFTYSEEALRFCFPELAAGCVAVRSHQSIKRLRCVCRRLHAAWQSASGISMEKTQ